jgi:hypothetical protein
MSCLSDTKGKDFVRHLVVFGFVQFGSVRFSLVRVAFNRILVVSGMWRLLVLRRSASLGASHWHSDSGT